MNPFNYVARVRAYCCGIAERRRRLYRIAYAWCYDRTLAEDLAQETLARGLKSLMQLRDLAALDGWLINILHNCWLDHLRRRRPTEHLDDVQETDFFVVDDGHDRHDMIARVRGAIAKLPVGQREALSLVELEGFSYPEVAQMLDVPLGTVTSRIGRARESLRTLLFEFKDEVRVHAPDLRRVK